jgi:hypothetical protein
MELLPISVLHNFHPIYLDWPSRASTRGAKLRFLLCKQVFDITSAVEYANNIDAAAPGI